MELENADRAFTFNSRSRSGTFAGRVYRGHGQREARIWISEPRYPGHRCQKSANDEDAAKQQFQTTLQQFQAVTHFNGGDLETEYNKLNYEYEACEARATGVSNRIATVEVAAQKLFDEWQSELQQYNNPELRRSSEQKLNETKERYQKLIGVMKGAESRMHPVLLAFHDQVLFLKHNLNASAIASLQTTAAGIDTDVSKLVKDMEASIAEADAFVSQMK